MLVDLKTVLEYAEKNNSAIGSFNYTNLETIQAILKAAETLNYPVILSFAPVHNIYNHMHFIAPIAIDLAKKSKVPVCIHLDHGMEMSDIKAAIDLGFTSVMFDGSHLPYDENVRLTKEVVAYARPRGVTVEAELGRLLSTGLEGIVDEELSSNPTFYYTNPKQAKDFVEQTQIDCLAISFGTVHGEYRSEPKLSFNIIEETRAILNGLPLVMHGGSGVSDLDYEKVIDAGIRKINYYTYMQIAGYSAVKKLIETNKTNQYHDVVKTGMHAMYENILKTIKTFSRSHRY